MKFEQLLQLVNAVSESDLTELKYENDGVKVAMKKTNGDVKIQQIVPAPSMFSPAPAMQTVPAAAPVPSVAVPETPENAAVETQRQDRKTVKSPLVGTFYAAPAEDAEPFVKVGDRVKEGQVLAIVEAMKLMNEIESECSGTIAEILVENGEAVEYGQPLFVLK